MRYKLEDLLDRALIGVAQVDSDGRFLLASDRYCKFLGRDSSDVLGATLHDFVHPEDLPSSLDTFIRVLETGEPRSVDHRLQASDGSTIWVGNAVSAGRDGTGPRYALVVAQDITARKAAERAAIQRQAELRMVMDSAAEGIYCIDRDGRLTLCNAAFLRMLGFAHEDEVLGSDIHALVHHSLADGSPYPKADCPVYKTAQSGIHAHMPEDVYFRADGTSLPVECWIRPIVREGEIQGAICTFVDITERRQADARQQLLTHELAHRMKNTLSMVQAIVGQTLRNSPVARETFKSINQRLMALGNAHTVLTRTRWGNASISDAVQSAIAIHQSEASRIRVTGPQLDLGARAALGLTMALHELCTNAVKYGALSNDKGHISIEWAISGGAVDARFHISWKESGGPPVVEPSHRGFGSRLIVEGIGPDLSGKVALLFEPSGVVWTLDAPLAKVRE